MYITCSTLSNLMLILLLKNVCVRLLCLYDYTCTISEGLQQSKEGVRFLGNGVMDDNFGNRDPLPEHRVLLASEPSLQAP